MGGMDQGFKDLLAEVVWLVKKEVNKRMEGEEFRERLSEINQKMSGRYGRVIDTIGIAVALEFATVPVPGGEGRGGREKTSFKFQFGGSPEDQEMKKEFGLDEEEMEQLLEQVRQERGDEKGGESITPADAEAAPQPRRDDAVAQPDRVLRQAHGPRLRLGGPP